MKLSVRHLWDYSCCHFDISAQATAKINRPASDAQVTSGQRALADAQFSVSRINAVTKLKGPKPPKGSSALENQNNFVYVVNATLSDGGTYLLDLDTGSSDTCFVDVYGSGYALGDVYKGAVGIGSVGAKIAFGVFSLESVLSGYSDDLLGLAYLSLGTVSKQIFSFYLSNANDGDNGEVTFEGYDSKRFTGPITYLPVKTPVLLSDPDNFYWWTFSGSGSVNPGTNDANGATPYAIADTGTTLLILANTTVYNICQVLELTYDDDFRWFTYDTNNTLPSVDFHLSGAKFSIPSSVYSFDTGSSSSYLGITNGGDGLPIFGDVFNKVAYTTLTKFRTELLEYWLVHIKFTMEVDESVDLLDIAAVLLDSFGGTEEVWILGYHKSKQFDQLRQYQLD
ncbi:hypothetical protein HK100_000621 [Physocladia obscura]|uniref:Peptidase A1 domain-containing protein n=1 Tax=Physocladia obscura TaxID=109957 RepID=A0AAD5SY07_9FUNG|nr:hypothetical protein HK100_000621 [Physocladia obscura]